MPMGLTWEGPEKAWMPKFYPGAEKELSPPSNCKRIDGDKNKVALIIRICEAHPIGDLFVNNGITSVWPRCGVF